LLQYLVVPKAQYRIALIAQPIVSLLIVGHLLSMVATIDLNDQPLFHANKINDVATDGFLSFEF